MFLYTNADSLPNKLQELKQLIVHLERNPEVISLTEVKYKNKWDINSAELNIHDILNLPMILKKTVDLLYRLEIIYLVSKPS